MGDVEKSWIPVLAHLIKSGDLATWNFRSLSLANREIIRAEYPGYNDDMLRALGWNERARCSHCGEMYAKANASCERQAYVAGAKSSSSPGHPRETLEARPIADQPPPAATAGRPVWEMVIEDVRSMRAPSTLRAIVMVHVLADMHERDRIGRERYGTPLQAHNGRDALVDACQEALDLCAYLRQSVEEERAASGAEACRFGSQDACFVHNGRRVSCERHCEYAIAIPSSEGAYSRALALVFEMRELIERRRAGA